jgi:cell division protein FtsX
MDSFIVTTKDKSTSALLRKILKTMSGVNSVAALSKKDKEDIAMIKAINKGHTKKYVNTTSFLKKLEGK